VPLSEIFYCGNVLQLRIERDIFVRFSPGASARSGPGVVMLFAKRGTCRLRVLERVEPSAYSDIGELFKSPVLLGDERSLLDSGNDADQSATILKMRKLSQTAPTTFNNACQGFY
jgi:hypothetical protein